MDPPSRPLVRGAIGRVRGAAVFVAQLLVEQHGVEGQRVLSTPQARLTTRSDVLATAWSVVTGAEAVDGPIWIGGNLTQSYKSS